MDFKKVTVNNIIPRKDLEGNILDAHGGAMFNWFEGRYYNYGVRYADLNKFLPGFSYVSYSSVDFENWVYHGRLLEEDAPVGFYYRPHVLYNHKLNKYVLWFLYFSMYGTQFKGPADPRFHREGAQKGIALSDTPTGPFKIVDIGIPMTNAKSGDHDLFLDDDGTAYLIYTSHEKDFKIYIDRLNDDFLSTTGESHSVDEEELGNEYPGRHAGCEAPALFKREGIYYALFGSRTDRGIEGGGLRVYMADSVMGPYRYINNINRDDQGKVIVPSQQCSAQPIQTKKGTEIIWSADRWESMPVLGESFQHWQLLEFNSDKTIKKLKSIDQWEMELLINRE